MTPCKANPLKLPIAATPAAIAEFDPAQQFHIQQACGSLPYLPIQNDYSSEGNLPC